MIDSNVLKFLCSKMECDEKDLEKNLIRLENARVLANSSSYNGIMHLKNMYYRKYLVNLDNIRRDDDSYVSRNIDFVISRQRTSLDMWLDYLLSDEVIYPEWFKYFIFQGVIKFGEYDELNGVYKDRDNSTIEPFIRVDYEVIAFIYDNLVKFLNGETLDDKELEDIFKVADFRDLYNYSMKMVEYNSIPSIDDKIKVSKLDIEIRKTDAKIDEISKMFDNPDLDEKESIELLNSKYWDLMHEIRKLREDRNWIMSLVKYSDKLELRKRKHDKYSYWIYLRNSYECIGEINYRKFHVQGYLGDVGYTIFPEFRGSGYALEALELLSEKLYEDNIPSFLITTYVDNIPSKKTIEKYGGKLSHIEKHVYDFEENDVLVYVCETRVRDDLKKVK